MCLFILLVFSDPQVHRIRTKDLVLFHDTHEGRIEFSRMGLCVALCK